MLPAILLSLLCADTTVAASLKPRPATLLRPRANTVPAPIAFPPTQGWEGIDGQWNTFGIRIGTPAQAVRVHISTTSQQIWAVHPEGCKSVRNDIELARCADTRGGIYNYNLSSTFRKQGLYDLVVEQNLGYKGNAEFGFDNVGLAYPGEGGPTLEGMTVGSLAVVDFWLGHFGLHPRSTNFTDFNNPRPSYLATLRGRNMIPSVSWGYTAGAQYRFSRVYASLTLGGYDANRFIPNPVSFPLAPDTDRDLLVSIHSITTTSEPNPLLDTPIFSFIDSTVSEIWLPLGACQAFETAFNLTFDPNSQLYLVSEPQHKALLAANPNITFTLSPLPTPDSPTVSITLPYSAFDLKAVPPYRNLTSVTNYFPLRRAENDGQYTLGRTFLQEAYLIVDWERSTFSVSQCAWTTPNPRQRLVPILPAKTVNGNTLPGAPGSGLQGEGSSKLSNGAIAGVVTSCALSVAGFAVLLFLWYRRKTKNRERKLQAELIAKKVEENDNSPGTARDSPVQDSNVFPKAELDASEEAELKMVEIGTDYKEPLPVEADTNTVFELPGDVPKTPEADGREFSEKEAMRHREERFNGVDVHGREPQSPTNTNGTNTLSSTTSATNNTSPISPISPQDTNGGGTTITSTLSTVSSNGQPSPVSPADSAAGTNRAGRRTRRRDRRRVAAADVAPYREGMTVTSQNGQEISPVSAGTSGAGTMTLGGIVSPVAEEPRRRFSFED